MCESQCLSNNEEAPATMNYESTKSDVVRSIGTGAAEELGKTTHATLTILARCKRIRKRNISSHVVLLKDKVVL